MFELDDDESSELGGRSECLSCGLVFWVVANNDIEIVESGLQIDFCPRCGEPLNA